MIVMGEAIGKSTAQGGRDVAITITAVILVLYAIWALRRRGAGQAGGISRTPAKKACKWVETGHSKGRFVEFRCQTCGVSAMPHTGKAPVDCKSNLSG